MKDGKRKRESNLTHTLPAVRVTKEVYEFYDRLREAERRRKISEVVRIALEDHASELQGQGQAA